MDEGVDTAYLFMRLNETMFNDYFRSIDTSTRGSQLLITRDTRICWRVFAVASTSRRHLRTGVLPTTAADLNISTWCALRAGGAE